MLSRIALNSRDLCTTGNRIEVFYHAGIWSMETTARYERLIQFLLHIQCLASSKPIYFFQKQIWGSVYGLFFYGVSSVNGNNSISMFQVSHQASFSSWARSECVTYVWKVSSPITCALN